MKKQSRISMEEFEDSFRKLQYDQERERRKRRRTSSSITTATTLPKELLVNIFSRLPLKSILKCRCVCTSWRSIILNPDFAKCHHERTVATATTTEVMLRPDGPGSLSRTLLLLDLDELKPYAEFVLPLNNELSCSGYDIVNSCNGLLCLCNYFDKNPVVICNPVIGEYINLPRTNKDIVVKDFTEFNHIACECSSCLEYGKFESQEKVVASGLGFSSRTNQYKVLRIFEPRKSHCFGGPKSYRRTAEIYTIGKGSWRSTEFPPKMLHCLLFGTYVKETMYWGCAMDDKFDLIISFNFDNERFGVVSPPPYLNANQRHKRTSQIRMKELGGCLCVCDFSSAKLFDIWMRKDFGGRKMWIKGYVIHTWYGKSYEPIKVVNKKKILMIQGLKTLVSYNYSENNFTYQKIRGIQSYFVASIHTPTFFSLKDIVKGDNLEVQLVKSM